MTPLATRSYGTRSVSTAVSKPSPTVNPLNSTTQSTLLRSAVSIVWSVAMNT